MKILGGIYTGIGVHTHTLCAIIIQILIKILKLCLQELKPTILSS